MTSTPAGSRAGKRPALGVFRFLVALAAFSLTTPIAATMLARLGLDRIVAAADSIVEGRVEGVRSFWQGKQIVTEVTLSVSHSLKGAAASRVVFIQIGGSVTSPVPVTMTVPGAPLHAVGDRGFYFLQPGAPGQKVLVGLSLGQILEKEDTSGSYVSYEGTRRTPGEFADEVIRLIAAQAPGRPDPGANR